jgi:hypothetical protein
MDVDAYLKEKLGNLSKEQVCAFLLSRGLSPYINRFGEMRDELTPEDIKKITDQYIQQKPKTKVVLPISNYRDEQRNLLNLIQGEINRLSKLKDELGLKKVSALEDLYIQVATSFDNNLVDTISRWKEGSNPSNHLFLTNLGILHQTNLKGLSIFSQSSDSSDFLNQLESNLEKIPKSSVS